MSKRRRGLSLRSAGQARFALHPRRRDRAAGEARRQRSLPMQIGSTLQEVLPQQRPLSTGRSATITSGSA